MEWRVQLSGDNSDLEELSKSFNSDNLKICSDGETYVLSSSDYNGITEAGIVLKKSAEILSLINGGSNVIQKLAKPIQVGSVYSIDDEGKRNINLFIKDNVLITESFRPTILVNGKVRETFTFEDLPNWVLLANQNRDAADVLNYLETGSNEIATLYKVYEIIKKDVGGDKTIKDNGWASIKKIERFTRTANSPDAIGDKARHGVQKNQPPKNPMSLSEAESLIRHLVKCWLASKIPN